MSYEESLPENLASAVGGIPLRKMPDRLLAALVERELLDEDQLRQVTLAMQDPEAMPLPVYLQAAQLVPTGVLLEILSEISGVPLVAVGDLNVCAAAAERISPRIAIDYHVMPLRLEEDPEVLVMAINRIPGLALEDDLRLTLGCPVRWMLCSTNAISRSIKHYYGVGIEAMLQLTDGGQDPDVPTFVSSIIAEAIACGATDIHVEPGDQSFGIRIRIDGALNRLPLPSAAAPYEITVALRSSVRRSYPR